MVIEIPDSIVALTNKDEKTLKLDLAVFFYKEFELTLSQASSFAEISLIQFLKELGNRNIPINYDEEDAEHDVKMAQQYFKTPQ
jgi:predicted HTH domain antitoxin